MCQGTCGNCQDAGQKPQKFMRDSPDYPIHFENDRLVVYSNRGGEVFVQHVCNGDSAVRIGSWGSKHQLEITACAGGDLVIGVSTFGQLPCVDVIAKK